MSKAGYYFLMYMVSTIVLRMVSETINGWGSVFVVVVFSLVNLGYFIAWIWEFFLKSMIKGGE